MASSGVIAGSVSDDLAGRVLARARKRKRPPTYYEFCSTLTYPGGPLESHPVDPDSDPCQAYLVRQMDLRCWDRIYVCAPPQYGGKTIYAVLLPILRNAIALRRPVGYGLPTLQDLDKAWATKLKPIFSKSGYKTHLPTSGPGARGGRGPTLQFHDPETGEDEGFINFMAGNAYGDTVADAIVDEVDQFRSADGTPQWGDLENIFNRANAYGRRATRIAVGTIEDDEQSIIIPLVETHGTGTRPWLKCPSCEGFQLVSWSQVSYDDSDEQSARISARIACRHCGVLWTEDDRQKALRACKFVHKTQKIEDGSDEVTGPAPKTGSLGLLWTAMDSSLTNLGEVCVEHLRAKTQRDSVSGDHGLMRKFYRYRLCEVYLGDKLDETVPNRLTRRYLLSRSEGSKYGPLEGNETEDGNTRKCSANCPTEVDSLVIAADVQRGGENAPGRIYYLLMGVSSDFRTYDLAWGDVVTSPRGSQSTEVDIHSGMSTLDALTSELAEKYGRTIVRAGVDVGDRQDEIRRWLIRYHRWWPLKGLGHTPKASPEWDVADWIYRREQEDRWFLYQIPVNIVRRQAQMQFLIAPGKPGAAHVPRGISPQMHLPRHYCGTAEIPDGRGGTRWSEKAIDKEFHGEWQRRVDWLDCRTYALAMAYQWHRATYYKPPRTPKKYGIIGSTFSK